MNDETLQARASALIGVPVTALAPSRPSGNSAVFRLDTPRGPFALKRYPIPDVRDRLGREFGALRFLAAHGCDEVPRAIAADAAASIAVYEWLLGEPVALDASAIDAMLAFARRLHGARNDTAARALPDAAEAVRTLADLDAQIAARLARLAAVTPDEPRLAAFLDATFRPAWACLRADAENVDGGSGRSAGVSLSPSDFGTHNMLRRDDGRFVFLDFEYFGWDDPVKLVSDVLWHPAMQLDAALAGQFRAGAADIYSDDVYYADRLRARFPLFGMRWALIVLNEFMPEAWARRRAAGAALAWSDTKMQQLAKAERLVARAVEVPTWST